MSKITSATIKSYLLNGIKKTGAIPMKNVSITVQPVGAFAKSKSTPTIINNSGFLASAKDLKDKFAIQITGADKILPQQAYAQDMSAMCAEQMAQIEAEMGNIRNEIEDMFSMAACQMGSIGILILTLLGCPTTDTKKHWGTGQRDDYDWDWDPNYNDSDDDGDWVDDEEDNYPYDNGKSFRYPPYLEDYFSTVNKNELKDVLVEFQVFINEGSDKAEYLAVNFNNVKSYAFKFRW